ncbi:MotA/TolQ/ExbB proton channel family protein [Breoghania sp. L-A4]|uniref:MotA/TolQ/ExbB proton channel family protein n=1 Tax=Breoghania sp. L-A4 TaxID=2304600 RepID=UPI000E35BB8B|nr:MotA/TolQ/ExbB proton channel family protein [Breoghania sp. L-A4]AXS41661.1 MotA/TolQ/ExbB proton channel family protein [Breoghania sp. L-A4]
MLSNLTQSVPAFARPLAELVQSGGPVVMLLLALSVVAVALIIAKLMQFAHLRVGSHARAQRALALWNDGRPQDALREVSAGRSVVCGVLQKLIQSGLRPGTNTELLRDDIERVCVNRVATLRAYLRPLDMISQTAPLIGLLGTVIGMIEAFQAMQGAGAAVDPSVLAGGIWVALLTTAVGLTIAIPVSAIVGWFDGKVEREEAEMESLVTAFFTGAVADRSAGTVVALESTSQGPRYAG